MNGTKLTLKLTLALAPLAAAGQGLVVPEAATLWPQWQARIAVQTTAVSPLSLVRPLESAGQPRAWQGASVVGDYYFASPSFGSFRASGGLLTGAQGGVPLFSAPAGPRLGLAVQSGAGPLAASEATGTSPYLGFGFTGEAWHQALSVTADFGIVAERTGAAGRALFGSQGMEGALRELRLSPVLQVGVRYAF